MTQVLVVCGVGGAGKTTSSAVLALDRALAGKRVVLMTIDPARRLADAGPPRQRDRTVDDEAKEGQKNEERQQGSDHPRSVRRLARSTVPKCRKTAIMMARPTAASAAAMLMAMINLNDIQGMAKDI